MYSSKDFKTFGWAFTGKDQAYSKQDYIQNGKFCESGLAYNSALNEAKCTSTFQVLHDSEVNPISDPYLCSPMNPNEKCRLKFEIEKDDDKKINDNTFVTDSGALRRNYIESDCKCALTD
jgi:hypothetical protein